MITMNDMRKPAFSILRLVILLYAAFLFAHYLNSKNYSDYINKTLIKIHAAANVGVDANELARLLETRDYIPLQKLLDRNYNIYALIITDCKTMQDRCDGQKILFATNPRLYGKQSFRLDHLIEFPYVLLRAPRNTSVIDLLAPQKRRTTQQAEIIGRVYSISTIPTFAEDYHMWGQSPFRDNELWRRYLVTLAISLLGGAGIWLIIELFLKIRRTDLLNAAKREAELMESADTYLRQLEENEERIKERERNFLQQFEAYVVRIRELEQRIQDVAHYREISGTIIAEMEEERNRQSAHFREELERTETEKLSLKNELERYRAATRKEKDEASRSLAQAIVPQFANSFEKQIFMSLTGSPAALKKEWLILPNLDVAGGKATSKVLDFAIVTRNCVMVIEAKNYWGHVTAEGDTANTRWHCADGSRAAVDVRSSWGVNPYQQVREYTMSLMNLLQRQPQWRLPVYGVVVFPATADLSAIDEQIGRFYRVTRSDHFIATLENIDAEARREHSFGKRPAPTEIVNVLLDRR